MLFSFFVGAGQSPGADEVEYFPPDAFLRRFSVTPPRISRQIPLANIGRLKPMLPSEEPPFWTLVQWNCIESVTDAHRQIFGQREALWKNAYQTLRVTVDEVGRPELRMSIDSLAIYNHASITYKTMERMRPHLLLSHNFYPDRDGVRRFGGAEEADTTPDGGQFPCLDSFRELTLSMRLRLVEAADLRQAYKADGPANRRNHYNRVPFQFWFRVYCRNAKDPAHGRFFWLGCRAYNNDWAYISRLGRERDHIESDGNATFAYLLGDLSTYGDDYERKINGLLAGEEIRIVMDVIGSARRRSRAIQQQKRDFLAAPADLSGYTLISFNIGWEPASPFRGTMALRDLSLHGGRR